MHEESFNRQLNALIEEIKTSDWNSDNAGSYTYLLDNLSGLSVSNINDKKGGILRFLADSYNGNNQMAIKIDEFIGFYTRK